MGFKMSGWSAFTKNGIKVEPAKMAAEAGQAKASAEAGGAMTYDKYQEWLAKNPPKKDDKKVTLDQSKIDAARVELNKLLYQYDRQRAYPDIGTQLDYIYHNGIDKWKTDIVDPVKNKYPKP